MAIKILGNQVSPTRKSTNVGSIQINTGAEQFNQAVSQFGATTRNAINQYATTKLTNELKYKMQVADTTIENSMQQLQQDILNPSSDLAMQPDTWEDVYEEQAQTILDTMLGSTDNKMLQTSIIASWNASKVKYEKDVVKKSAERTSNLLQQSYVQKFDKTKELLTGVTDLNELQIITDNFTRNVNEYAASGFLSNDQTTKDLYETYVGEAIRLRVGNAAADMEMSAFIDAYETGTLGDGDPITEMMMGMLDEDQVETILDDAFDKKVNRIKAINDAESKLEVRYNNTLEKNILDMDGEADPKIKSQKHEQLLVQYAGDDDALKKIKTAYETDFALYDDANLNINYIKKEINFGNLSLDDVLDLKTKLSQETFKILEDTYNNSISPRSELANNLKSRIKSQVYGSNDGFLEIITEEDPTLAAMFADSLSTFNEEFEMRMENIQPNETPQGIYEEIVAKAESVVSQRKAKTVFMEIQSLRDDDKNVGIVFDLMNISQTKENIKQSGVSESRKRLLINRIDQLNLIYGQDKTIFKLASEME